MTERLDQTPPTPFQCWSRIMTNLVDYPWRVFEAQCSTGLKLVEMWLGTYVLKGASSQERDMLPALTIPEEIKRLECQALERVRRGLAPPREIYEAPYREQIDWTRFPDWARPSDPELFQDCVHEG